jgi:hypothetical protein
MWIAAARKKVGSRGRHDAPHRPVAAKPRRRGDFTTKSQRARRRGNHRCTQMDTDKNDCAPKARGSLSGTTRAVAHGRRDAFVFIPSCLCASVFHFLLRVFAPPRANSFLRDLCDFVVKPASGRPPGPAEGRPDDKPETRPDETWRAYRSKNPFPISSPGSWVKDAVPV